MTATAVLEPEFALAAEASPPRAVVAALAGADPLRLDLPPLPGLAAAPAALRALSALYLAARLEQAAVVPVAEAIVRQRAILRVPPTTAALLEDLARRQPQYLSPEQRAALFARLFGIGTATDASGAGARFEPRLAALCSALVECGPRAAGASDTLRLRVQFAARDLAQTAGTTLGSGATLAVPRLIDHVRRSLALLADPGIGALVGARGVWQTLQALLGSGAPDLGRVIDCARHGQRVLAWLSAEVATPGASGNSAGPLGADVVASAAAWLTACGLPPRTSWEGSV